MATGKTYTMEMVLNAVMGSSFSGTMSSAQQEFANLGTKIQELNKTQSDIAAWTKQQQAVENTASKLDNYRQRLETVDTRIQKNAENQELLRQQLERVDQEMSSASGPALEQLASKHDQLQKELNETTSESAKLQEQKLKLQQTISNTESTLGRQEERLRSTGERLREAGVDTSNLTQEQARLAAESRELKERQDEVAKSAQQMGSQSSSAVESMAEAIASAGLVEALSEVKDAFTACVEIAANFEESMSNVEALSGATADAMEQLSDKAKQIGADTKYTATEAADAMGYMAMAGWKSEQMLSGMSGVINLALASGEQLASVSDIVTDNLTAFGLAAEDTAHFSDVLAATATNSNTSVSAMGETFKQAASVAGALGFSIEDTAIAVGLMANAGVKGSSAGTALKNTFNGLLEGCTLLSAEMGEVEFSAVNADGTMKSFRECIDELRVAFDGMTEAEKVSNAQQLAGLRGYNGLLAIINSTEADYNKLASAIDNCSGAAQNMADIKMDNLNGDLALMSSAWDAVKTSIGEQFIPVARQAVEVITEVLTGVNDFIKNNEPLVKGIATAAGVIGTVTAAVSGFAAVSKVATTAMGALTTAIGVTSLGPIAAGVGAIAAVAGGFIALKTAAGNAAEELGITVESVDELSEAALNAQENLEAANETFESTATANRESAIEVDMYIDRLEELQQELGGSIGSSTEYKNILQILIDTVPEFADTINVETRAIKGGVEALREQNNELQKNATQQAYQEYYQSVYEDYAAVQAEIVENSIKQTEAENKLQAAMDAKNAAIDEMNRLEAKSAENGGMTTAQSDRYTQLRKSLGTYNQEIVAYQEQLSNLDEAHAEQETALSEVEGQLEIVQQAMEDANKTTYDSGTAFENFFNTVSGAANSAINDMGEDLTTLIERYDNAYQAAYDSISDQVGLFENMSDSLSEAKDNMKESFHVIGSDSATAKNQVSSSVEGMIVSLRSQAEYMNEYSANIKKAAEMGLSEGLIAQLSDGSAESAAYLGAIVSSGEQGIKDLNAAFESVEEGKENFAESVREASGDFDEEIGNMEDRMEEAVENLDLSDDAKQAALDTINAYIESIRNSKGSAAAAAADVRSAVESALNGTEYRFNLTHSGASSAYGGSVPKSWTVTNSTPSGYASGTDSAPPGWAWVGEEGPELINFGGGETVLPSSVSERLATVGNLEFLSSASNAPQINVSVQVAGNATAETAASLKDAADEIAEKVWDRFQEQQYDASRRAW